MGCRQHVEFARLDPRLDARRILEDFVLGEFLDSSALGESRRHSRRLRG
jgi:hypothetical protein